MTTTSETAFTHSPETIYDFVTNPANWTKTYPGRAHVGSDTNDLPFTLFDQTGPVGGIQQSVLVRPMPKR